MNRVELVSGFFRHLAQTSSSPMAMVVSEATGSIIRDAEGRDHIDLLAGMGVAATGHRHPKVVARIEEQLGRHLHVMVYGEMIQETQVALAQGLASLLPATLDSVYFTNSGTEAVEGALKLARKARGRNRLMAFHGAFHGDTLGAVSVGGNPHYRDPFEPLLPDVGFLAMDDRDGLAAIDDSVAAVIVEPVQAEAGVIIPSPGFLAALRERCSETGSLLIFDEVITGLGRTGTMFAFEREQVVPDLLVLAKALGGGLPLGAFIASRDLMASLCQDPELGHVTTFGGHPLSAAAGLAALEVIIEEQLAERAETAGAHFEERLTALLSGPCLETVRRRGLLLGLVMDSAARTQAFVKQCRAERLVLGWTLHDDRVLRLAPPLVITEAELEESALRMQRALARVS
ncbi:aspartate aminotransferase family protein [Pseudomonas sp.]|uniref:aspartate aminotransferase family protein n=1 Tax=Pseudomonas sp. TaxID=306 RepID=UPI003982670C